MQFKTKDLLVTVLPKATDVQDLAKICYLRTFICRTPTYIVCHQFSPTLCRFACSFYVSIKPGPGCGFGNSCGPGNSACDPTIFCGISNDPWIIEDLEDLATVRRELQDTLGKLDALEKEGLPGSIRTKAEAEALEASLTAALEKVRAEKGNLK
jgi:hypothetical protein